MRRYLLSFLLFCFAFVGKLTYLFAQCTQCKSAAASKDEAGNLYVGEAMNFGVLYLLLLPFIGIALIGGYWFFRSYQLKKEAAREQAF